MDCARGGPIRAIDLTSDEPRNGVVSGLWGDGICPLPTAQDPRIGVAWDTPYIVAVRKEAEWRLADDESGSGACYLFYVTFAWLFSASRVDTSIKGWQHC